VGAAIKRDSVPERALLRARAEDVIALSAAVEAEIVEVFSRPKFIGSMTGTRRDHVLGLIRDAAARFEPTVRVTDCRDAKDNKYLELALAASARESVRNAGPAPRLSTRHARVRPSAGLFRSRFDDRPFRCLAPVMRLRMQRMGFRCIVFARNWF
jgi:hypothetical protein